MWGATIRLEFRCMPAEQKFVFVVEDDPDVRDSLHAVISTRGFTCRTFESAEALLAVWEKSSCEFLFIDVDLPGINGSDLLHQIRAAGSTTEAIFYSGRINDGILRAAANLGDIPVLQKGNNISAIVKCLKDRIGESDGSNPYAAATLGTQGECCFTRSGKSLWRFSAPARFR